MYCVKCGKQYDDSVNFCPYCGAPNVGGNGNQMSREGQKGTMNSGSDIYGSHSIKKMNGFSERNNSENQYTSSPSSSENGDKRQKGNHAQTMQTARKSPVKKLIIAAIIVVAAIIAATVINKKRPIVIDPMDYMTVGFSGYNGTGNAEASFDSSSLEKAIQDGMVRTGQMRKNSSEGSGDYLQAVMITEACINYQFDKGSGLKNGDKVVFTINCDNPTDLKQYNIELKSSSKTFTVKDLEKIDTFDAFADVDVSFSGADGYGTAEIKGGYDRIVFSVDPSSGLSNGETVTVTATPWDYNDFNDYANANGKIPEATTKKYKVSGLKEIKDFDAFSEDMIKVSFGGTNGEGTAIVETPGAEKYGLRYSLDKEDGLSNGDTVTVTVTPDGYMTGDYSGEFDEPYIGQYGGKPKETSKTYTVAGLQEYVTDASQISEDSLNGLKKASETMIQSLDDGDSDFSANSRTYVGYYFLTPKSGQDTDYKNILVLVYNQNSTDNESSSHKGQAFDSTFGVVYSNLLLEADGSVTVNQQDAKLAYSSSISADSYIPGYDNVQDLYSKLVTPYLEGYSSTTDITL